MSRRLLAWLILTVAVPAAVEALEFVSPTPGTVVKAGATVAMRVRLSAGEQATEVGFITGDGSTAAAAGAAGVFEAQVSIPREAVGPDIIAAYAQLEGGGLSFARLEVVVDAGPLRSLLVSAPPLLTFAGQVEAVAVRGIFEDGILRDLADPERGTTYASSEATVLATHSSGLIQARSSGKATLTVASRGRTASVEVEVRIPPEATNRIPIVSAPDIQVVIAESMVHLSAIATDPDGDALSFEWEQADGRLVVLRDPNVPQPWFIAPHVAVEHAMEFVVTVRDPKGATSLPVAVRVIVRPKEPVG